MFNKYDQTKNSEINNEYNEIFDKQNNDINKNSFEEFNELKFKNNCTIIIEKLKLIYDEFQNNTEQNIVNISKDIQNFFIVRKINDFVKFLNKNENKENKQIKIPTKNNNQNIINEIKSQMKEYYKMVVSTNLIKVQKAISVKKKGNIISYRKKEFDGNKENNKKILGIKRLRVSSNETDLKKKENKDTPKKTIIDLGGVKKKEKKKSKIDLSGKKINSSMKEQLDTISKKGNQKFLQNQIKNMNEKNIINIEEEKLRENITDILSKLGKNKKMNLSDLSTKKKLDSLKSKYLIKGIEIINIKDIKRKKSKNKRKEEEEKSTPIRNLDKIPKGILKKTQSFILDSPLKPKSDNINLSKNQFSDSSITSTKSILFQGGLQPKTKSFSEIFKSPSKLKATPLKRRHITEKKEYINKQIGNEDNKIGSIINLIDKKRSITFSEEKIIKEYNPKTVVKDVKKREIRRSPLEKKKAE